MSGLSPSSVDIAISSRRELAYVLKNLPISQYTIQIGSGQVSTGDTGAATAGTGATTIECAGKAWITDQWVNCEVSITGKGTGVVTTNDADTLTLQAPGIAGAVSLDNFTIIVNVNPILGNNFQMEWDDGGSQVVIHNDFPIYSGGDYYYITALDPTTDKNVALATLINGATPYNHMFLVNGAAHIGSLEIVPTADTTEPATVGTKVIYIGWVYRGADDEIVIKNIGRLIDLAFLSSPITYVDYLDTNTSVKTTIYNHILRYIGFFGPNVSKTVREVGLFIKDELSSSVMITYSKVDDHILLTSENLRVTWKITV